MNQNLDKRIVILESNGQDWPINKLKTSSSALPVQQGFLKYTSISTTLLHSS